MGNPAAGWTPERRQRQREAIQRWKPWNQSTGPTSCEGKAATSNNAYAGGESMRIRSAIRLLNQAMREQRDLLGR